MFCVFSFLSLFFLFQYNNIQVFDVSMNRIRDLTKKSFARYSDLKYLYLFENMIWVIEDGTFSDLTDLEVKHYSASLLSILNFTKHMHKYLHSTNYLWCALNLLRVIYLIHRPWISHPTCCSPYRWSCFRCRDYVICMWPTINWFIWTFH